MKNLGFKSAESMSQLANDFSRALESEKFGDVTFKVGEKSLKAMKGVLAVRSPVFAGMFDHATMKENQKNEVIISDIDEKVFKELLYFIYTDTAPKIEDMPLELLVAAEKYQLLQLKNMCEEVLIKNMAIENVTGFLVFGSTNNATNLKKSSIGFIKRNLQMITKTEEFQSMKQTHSELFVEILEELANAE